MLLSLCFSILFASHVQTYQPEGHAYAINEGNDLSGIMSNILFHIQKGEFCEADEKLNRLNVSSPNIYIILGITYANLVRNYDLFLTYSRASSTSDQMSNATTMTAARCNDHWNLHNMTAFYDMLFHSVIHYQQESEELKATRYEVHHSIATVLQEAEININYQNTPPNSRIQMINSLLQEIGKPISDDTYHKLIEVVTDHIVRDMCNNQNAKQVVTAVVFLFEKVLGNRNASDRSEMLIADCLKRLRDTPDFSKLPAEDMNKTASAFNHLPQSIRNLYFAEMVWIRNVFYSEYLYTPDSDFEYLDDEEDVVSLISSSANKSCEDQSQWIVKRDKDNEFAFTFRSNDKSGEFLYASDEMYDNDKYRVMTWLAEGSVGNKTSWGIVPVVDKVYFLYLPFNGYMCMTDNPRKFFVEKDKTENSAKCQWTIENCGGKY